MNYMNCMEMKDKCEQIGIELKDDFLKDFLSMCAAFFESLSRECEC